MTSNLKRKQHILYLSAATDIMDHRIPIRSPHRHIDDDPDMVQVARDPPGYDVPRKIVRPTVCDR